MTREELYALLDESVAQQRLRQVDVALAHFLGERDPAAAPCVLWLGALLSRQLADGHLCLELDTLAALADEQSWPASWRPLLHEVVQGPGALTASPLIAGGGDAQLTGPSNAAPMVCEHNRLYLRRYWNHERMVASAIRDRLAQPPPMPAALAEELARLFPPMPTAEAQPARDGLSPDPNSSRTGCAPADSSLPDWPKIACALAARGSFTVITGGPGTGKTTTVVRVLGLLQTLHLREHARPLRIRLAAPTGKAAARLNASIVSQIAQLDVDDNVRAAIPAEVVTLHRLLGARPDTRRFRHDHGHPLHLDVLVVDEASMIDLEMMSALLAALPAQARLILLGDKDQLSSVEAGAVLGDLCHHAEGGHYSADTAAWVQATAGDDIHRFVRDDAQPLDQQVAMLRHSHRFGSHSGIGQLAAAVNSGNPALVQQVLDGGLGDLAWTTSATPTQLTALAIEGEARSMREKDDANTSTRNGYRHYLEQLRRQRPTSNDAAAQDHWAFAVLQAFNRFQLLCALRRGPHGVDGLNPLIGEALLQRGLIEANHGWYEGRPVMITRNDYSLGLANGDVGVCLRMPDQDGRSRLIVAFDANPGVGVTGGPRLRQVLPSRLGDVVTVYAMTVHKSQGSEFDHTALVLPDEINPVLTRELLYTGITRARQHFSLVGSKAMIELATRQRTRRFSGLAGRLSEFDHR